MVATAALAAALAASLRAAAAAPPHVISVIVDDLGFWDTQVHNDNSFMTENFGYLAHEGITLMRHHTYIYCSPTRRSFLSGRFPVHITGIQAPTCSNYLPLKFTLLPAKLKRAGYETHMVGKGHLGYQTTDHLPVNRGFDSHVGYLGGAEDYHWGNEPYMTQAHCAATGTTCQKDMWLNHVPGVSVVDDIYYSANFYSDRAQGLIRARDKAKPFYLHLTYQSVHAPWQEPPELEQIPHGTHWWDHTWGSMLNAVDNGIGNVTKALQAADMWDDTLIILTSDNGGSCGFANEPKHPDCKVCPVAGGEPAPPPGFWTEPANNYPLRGRKCSPWDGGTRTVAFVSGGFIPAALRGTKSDVLMHVADWYATVAKLAGVDAHDVVQIGGGSHDIDGVDMWPAITGANRTNPRPVLPTSQWSLLSAEGNNRMLKLITSAYRTNWFLPNGTNIMDETPCVEGTVGGDPAAGELPDAGMGADSGVQPEGLDGRCLVCSVEHPCLFDVLNDPSERVNLATMPEYEQDVGRLGALLAGYEAYVDGNMTAEELQPYECVANPAEWWHNYAGPCCKRKGQA